MIINNSTQKYNNKFYNDYIDHKAALNKDLFKRNNLLYESEIDLINRIFADKNIRILEYGAGLGAWLKSIKNAGYKNLYAIEISKLWVLGDISINVILQF